MYGIESLSRASRYRNSNRRCAKNEFTAEIGVLFEFKSPDTSNTNGAADGVVVGEGIIDVEFNADSVVLSPLYPRLIPLDDHH